MGDVGPGHEGSCSFGSVVSGREVIAVAVAEVVDLVASGEEPRHLTGRLESLHLALSSSSWLVCILGSGVEAIAPVKLDARHHRAVAAL